MDKVAASGAADTGSIPVWDAKVKKLAIAGFFFISTQESCLARKSTYSVLRQANP